MFQRKNNNDKRRKIAKAFLLIVTLAWSWFGIGGMVMIFLSIKGIGPIEPDEETLLWLLCSAVVTAIVASLLFVRVVFAKTTTKFLVRLSQVLVWAMMLHAVVLSVFHIPVAPIITIFSAFLFLLVGIIISKVTQIAANQ